MLGKIKSKTHLAASKKVFTEEELVSSLKLNDRVAFDYLYNSYSGALYNIIHKIVKDDERASDVLQDAFVKIWKNIANYSPEKGRLFTWMLNIVRNTAIDAFRSDSNRPGFDDIESSLSRVEQTANYQPSIQTIDVRNIVEKLKPDRKLLIDLVYFQGYTQEEAAEELKIPLGTAKTRLRTAVQDLKMFFKV